jgi:hypothetical protein
MNAGDKPSPASWRRAAGNAAKTENPAKQGGLTDFCSEPKKQESKKHVNVIYCLHVSLDILN